MPYPEPPIQPSQTLAQPGMGSLNPFLASLMSRWNDVMDIQTKRLEAQPARDDIAFRRWNEGKIIEQQQAEEASAARKTEAYYSKRRIDAEERRRIDEARIAEQQRRAGLQASVARNALKTGYGMSAIPYTPDADIADYYTYGAGNPQGRGGGADSRGQGAADDSHAWENQQARDKWMAYGRG
jgi:hypothetical protein